MIGMVKKRKAISTIIKIKLNDELDLEFYYFRILDGSFISI